MATTSPWNIPLFDGSSPFDPIQAPFNAQSDALNTALGTAVQAGDIKFTARTTAPAGWLVANGAAISRTTYAVLFAAIGTAFGTGDGSTTFGLPDLRERVPVGASAGSAEFGTVGATYGEKKHQITIPEMAAHTHSGSSVPLYYMGIGGTANFTPGGNNQVGSPVYSVGGDQAHNNIQPSIALTPLIKF